MSLARSMRLSRFNAVVRSLLSLLAMGAAQLGFHAPQAQANSPLKIGVILPLTGGWASWGQKIRQGLELSAEKLSHPISLSFDDEGTCEAQKGVAAARRFFAQDYKILIIGCVATTRALLGESKQRSEIIFSAGLLDRASFEQGAPVVSFATQVGTEAIYLARYLAAQRHTSVAIVRPQEPFGEELAAVLTSELTKKGISIAFDDSDSVTNNDFSIATVKILSRKPSAVVMNLGEAQQLAFLKRFRESKSAATIVSTYGLESNSTSKENAKQLEGVTYTYPFNSSEKAPEKVAFDQEFAREFKSEPNANAYFVYDGLQILDQALSSCAGADSHCIFEHFRNHGHSQGISGEVTYRADGSTDRPYRMKRVINGEFVWLPEKE